MRSLPCILIVLAVQGCQPSESGSDETASGKPGLVAPGELERLEASLLDQLAANRARKCPRPVLRGQAQPGPLDADLLGYLDSAGALGTCFAAVQPASRIEARLRGNNRSLELEKTAGDEALRAVRTACAELPAWLERVVAHEDACSPFLPGRHGTRSLLNLMRGSWAAVVLARQLEREGSELAASQLLLDAIRLGEDIGRGGTSVLEPVIGGVAQGIALVELARLLVKAPLDDAVLADITRQLELLWVTRVPLRDTLLAIDDENELHVLLRALRGPSWVPPGGHHEDSEAQTIEAPGLGADGFVLAWVALENVERAWERACPASRTLRECVEGMRRSANHRASAGKIGARALLEWLVAEHPTGGKEAVRRMLRELFIGGIEAIHTTAYPKYGNRLAVDTALLESVDLLARSLLASRGSGACPAPLRQDGVGLLLAAGSAGNHEITTPPWIQNDRRYPQRLLTAVPCPAKP